MSERNFNNFFLSKTFLKNSGKPTARDLERIKEYIERSINIAVGNRGIDNTTYGKTLKARFRDSIKRINQFEKRSEKLNVSVRKLGGTDTRFMIKADSVMYLPTLETGRGPSNLGISDELKESANRNFETIKKRLVKGIAPILNGRRLVRRGASIEYAQRSANYRTGGGSEIVQSEIWETKPFVAWDDSRDPKSRIRRWIRKNRIKLKYAGLKKRKSKMAMSSLTNPNGVKREWLKPPKFSGDKTKAAVERHRLAIKAYDEKRRKLEKWRARERLSKKETEERQLAYIIARSIRKKGTKLYQKGKGKRVRKVYSHILPLFNEQLNKRLTSALQAYYSSYIQQYLYNSINTQEFN